MTSIWKDVWIVVKPSCPLVIVPCEAFLPISSYNAEMNGETLGWLQMTVMSIEINHQ